MKALRRVGDALLGKLVPEAKAEAASCYSGCPSYKQYKCEVFRLFERCCYQAKSPYCPQAYCGPWDRISFC